jgi:hypothetical protein
MPRLWSNVGCEIARRALAEQVEHFFKGLSLTF